MDLRCILSDELRRRMARNPRYSRRAYARSLGVHHTTLIRYLDGSRGLSPRMLHRIGMRMGLGAHGVRAIQSAEAARKVLEATQTQGFRIDCRWIAMKTGLGVDDVNRALHQLLYDRRIEMTSTTRWSAVA